MASLGWRHLTEDDKSTIARGVRDGVAYGGPFHAEIYPADRCNIDCFFCSTAAIRGNDELPLSRIEELMAELKEAGTRSVRLAGGGEPLFHRKTKDMLRAIAAAKLPIENITTNAVLLGDEVASILIDRCDEITVSLNTADPESYASMMQTPARNFERVLHNVRNLLEERRRQSAKSPLIELQFLVWRDNYKTIPRMYELARELDVDSIIFNGLGFLRPDQMMSAEQTAEMMRLYEEVVRIDEYRRIAIIDSYEQDIRPQLAEMNARIQAERNARGTFGRLAHFVTRRDVPLVQKIQHHRKVAKLQKIDRELAGLDEPCLIGWHSLVVRTTGMIAPCCILQASPLGNIFKESVREVWYGEGYARFRSELSRIIRERAAWSHDAQADRTVVPMCGGKAAEICPIKSFYYRTDVPFVRAIQ
ncbi:MAG TPA: radical SAM protein [Thermoanaerobaculia bacterium]|nr:radical SAM protein [Thermoanaerobaculia bacterium]